MPAALFPTRNRTTCYWCIAGYCVSYMLGITNLKTGQMFKCDEKNKEDERKKEREKERERERERRAKNKRRETIAGPQINIFLAIQD